MSFLTRQAWIIPLAFALAFSVVGYLNLSELERHQRAQMQSEVESRLRAAVAALQVWTEANSATALVLAQDPRIQERVVTLAELARTAAEPIEALRASPLQKELQQVMRPIAEAYGTTGWGGMDRNGLMVANQEDSFVGQRPRASAAITPDVLEGKVRHTAPLIWDPEGDAAPSVVTMIVLAPVRNEQGRVVATFGYAMDPLAKFTHLLATARLGSSGETYAFDANGVLVSSSRFEDQLREIGLLPDDPNVPAALMLSIRAPGGDMTQGFVPDLPVAARPLTKAAASAISGESGFDVDGYPDYRGVPVIGAWTWLPELQVGIATEVDVAEAYAGLASVRLRFAILLGLLVAGSLTMLVYSLVVARLRGRVEEARQLGRYSLEKKLGQGGMGTVYLARHALLRRPTAIKVLEGGEVAGSTGSATEGEHVTRFEREVQVTSSLTHPNTIEIYDFGSAPDGSFYYAMEYVGGLTLSALVEHDGPQPEARVLHLMRQVAGSLAEAHAAGVIHRDLKPSNIMLCERGGLVDFVKVLDFGLVRITGGDDLAITSTQALTGTPLYMSPEAVENPKGVDARADVYQLGAVAYFLLTGRPPFEGKTVVDVLAKHMQERPEPPSEVLGHAVSVELERIILRCLEKDPDARFEDAGALVEALESCPVEGTWDQRQARAWWQRWIEDHQEELDGASSGGSAPSGYMIDLAERLQRSSR
jgi:hypothetical protein